MPTDKHRETRIVKHAGFSHLFSIQKDRSGFVDILEICYLGSQASLDPCPERCFSVNRTHSCGGHTQVPCKGICFKGVLM